MKNQIKNISKSVAILLAALLILLLITSCNTQESSTSIHPSSDNQVEDSEQNQVTRIAIRNGTPWGGLAATAGELLKDEGYIFKNGYTIDIANAEPTSKSRIIIRENDETAYKEAEKIQEILDFTIVVSNPHFRSHLPEVEEQDSHATIVILFAEDDFDPWFTNKYSDFEYNYPPQPAGDYSVLQIEPYEGSE